jgi:hypothetical protein
MGVPIDFVPISIGGIHAECIKTVESSKIESPSEMARFQEG